LEGDKCLSIEINLSSPQNHEKDFSLQIIDSEIPKLSFLDSYSFLSIHV